MKFAERARELRKSIELTTQSLDDAEALKVIELHPAWATDTEYKAAQKVRYNGVLYRCLQDHTSQDTWTPTDAPSLWAKVLNPDPEVIPDWEQPDSTNSYHKGDKVRFEGHIYESLIDNNIWSPSAYPAGWKQLD